jgi:hypothetical protein
MDLIAPKVASDLPRAFAKLPEVLVAFGSQLRKERPHGESGVMPFVAALGPLSSRATWQTGHKSQRTDMKVCWSPRRRIESTEFEIQRTEGTQR